MADLAPEVLKRLTCGRESSAVSLCDLCLLAEEAWGSRIGVSLLLVKNSARMKNWAQCRHKTSQFRLKPAVRACYSLHLWNIFKTN